MQATAESVIAVPCVVYGALVALFSIGLALAPGQGHAGRVMLTPELSTRVEYDDNTLFSPSSPRADFLAGVASSLRLGLEEERLKLQSSAGVDVVRYASETELDREDVRAAARADYQLSERLGLGADFAFVNDTTRDEETLDTGVETVRVNRWQYAGGVSVRYQATERSDVGLAYRHVDTSYQGGGSIDSRTDFAELSFTLQPWGEMDAFTVRPHYTRDDSQTSTVDTVGALAGWSHTFSERLDASAFVGGSWTHVSYRFVVQEVAFDPTAFPPFVVVYRRETATSQEWNWLADVSVRWRGETSEVSLGYDRNLAYSSVGDPVQIDAVTVSWNQRLLERLSAGLGAVLSRTSSAGEFEQQDTRYFQLSPGLRYYLSENHWVDIGYSYAFQVDTAQSDDSTVRRNRVWVNAAFAFPAEW